MDHDIRDLIDFTENADGSMSIVPKRDAAEISFPDPRWPVGPANCFRVAGVGYATLSAALHASRESS